ncbi:MAG: type II secretion system F family protein [Caulobacterales bacterium]|nr:type II secretion system F family protein [Caulobacterales bacterium]
MLMILAAVLGFVTITSLGFAFVGGEDSSARAVKRAQVLGHHRGKANAKKGTGPLTPEQRRKQIMLQLKEVDRKERKARVTMEAKLQQAGVGMKVQVFWMISAGLAVFALLFGLLFGTPWFILPALPIVFGLGLPRWVVGFLAKRRIKKFTSDFADAIDIIVRGIKSGLPVHDCLKVIAKEMSAPIGPEFQRLVESVGMGMSLEQALDKMFTRIPTPELRFLAIVVSIQAKTGGNLAEALNNLSTVLRSRKLMAEKIKALSSEATASAAIIGCLPPGVMAMVTVTTPSYMMLMFTDIRGQLMLMGAGLWMGAGIFMMRKMINFKF